MFEEKKSFPWKIPAIIMVCVLVLGGGIYIGVKSRVNNESINKLANVDESKDIASEAFKFSPGLVFSMRIFNVSEIPM